MSDPLVLFVDDEEDLRIAAEQSLMLEDIPIRCFATAEEALQLIGPGFAGILVTDIRMKGMDGLTLMQRCLQRDRDLPVILITGHGDVELAVRSMRDGAYDFIEKPFAPARLVSAVRRALEKRRLTMENRDLRSRIDKGGPIANRIVGQSKIIRQLRQLIRNVAPTDTDVLIVGETGSGKDVVARALHESSNRKAGPFVHINCAALPADLIESELFGHEAGAFAGASRARYGKFEHARGGTVFLDEIDSLSMPLQAKLLHAIQDRVITRLGSNDPITLDTRFIAASKRDLEQEAAEGLFRNDLLYRLNVVTLRVPSLHARREDIAELFAGFVAQAAARTGQPLQQIPGAVTNALVARDWPGNVRELRNVAERFVLGFDLEDLLADPDKDTGTLAEKVAAYEKSLIAASIAAHGGHLRSTYEVLGLSRKALYEKMQKYGLSRDRDSQKD